MPLKWPTFGFHYSSTELFMMLLFQSINASVHRRHSFFQILVNQIRIVGCHIFDIVNVDDCIVCARGVNEGIKGFMVYPTISLFILLICVNFISLGLYRVWIY